MDSEQDDKIFIKGIVIVIISAFLVWLMFYFINS